MSAITDDLVHGLEERGWQVSIISMDPLSARLMAASTDTGEQCEIDVLKENQWMPPDLTPYGPVLGLDDVIGTKVRALADRAAPRAPCPQNRSHKCVSGPRHGSATSSSG